MQNTEENKITEDENKIESPINENSGILVDEHLRIFDPETNKDVINKRGES